MGLFSSIKKAVSGAYKTVDKAVGGHLPGGVAPKSSSSSSQTSTSSSSSPSSSSTTTSSSSSGGGSRSSGGGSSRGSSGGQTVIVQNLPAEQADAVIVTDFESGESVTTKVSPQGRITAQSYSGGGSSSSGAVGETTALQAASREDGLVSQTVTAKQQATNVNTQGTGLKPGQSSVQNLEYTGEVPQRYEKSAGSALGQSAKNIFSFGTIGTYGLGRYFSDIGKPFEYVGGTKATDIRPNLQLQNWQGTEFGYGVPEDQKNQYRPEGFKKETYFEFSERQKAKLYGEAGLSYTGQPASLIPLRVQEDVVKDVRPQYESKIKEASENLQTVYQGKIQRGEISVSEAQKLYARDIQNISASYGEQYKIDVEKTYQTRIQNLGGSSFTKRIVQAEQFESDIFQSKGTKAFQTTTKVIETGALIGATTFGGSGVTLAASTYLGLRTAKSAVDYAGAFPELSTKQKILGGAGVAAGAVATGYTFRLGVNRFYSEWRGIIYSDLAQQRAKVLGKEVARYGDTTQYKIASLQRSGPDQALTLQNTEVYRTGPDRIGFFSKGQTTTRIFDPQYEKYITTTQAFKTGGYVPNIKTSGFTVRSGGIGVTFPKASTGLGRAKIVTGENVRDVRFIAGSSSQKGYYAVVGGNTPQRVSFGGIDKNIYGVTSKVRSGVSGSGKIYKLQGGATPGDIIFSPSKSALAQQTQNVGAAAALQSTKIAQLQNVQNLAQQGASGASQVIGTQTAAQGIRFAQTESLQAQQLPQQRQEFVLVPRSQDLLPQFSQAQQRSLASVQSQRSSSRSQQISQQVNAQNVQFVQVPAEALRSSQVQRLSLRSGLINPALAPTLAAYNFVPTEPNAPRFRIPGFNLNPGGEGLATTVIRGGQRRTGYTPSYTALVFKIRGTYQRTKLSQSGIDFRPIIKGFKFKTGV